MSWFRVEDGFHGHPKVRAAGNAAVGLWVRCATYSAAYDLDGFVPADVPAEFGTRAEAAALERVRLWVPAEGGVMIPDFLAYNPSAVETRARRERDAERKRHQRARGAAAVDHDPTTGRFTHRDVTA